MSSKEELRGGIEVCNELLEDLRNQDDAYLVEQKRDKLQKRLNYLNSFKIGKGYDEKLDTSNSIDNSSK